MIWEFWAKVQDTDSTGSVPECLAQRICASRIGALEVIVVSGLVDVTLDAQDFQNVVHFVVVHLDFDLSKKIKQFLTIA